MSTNQKTLRIGLWKKKSKKGEVYYGTVYKGKRYAILKNSKPVGKNAPDLYLLVTDLPQGQQKQSNQQTQQQNEDMF